MIRPYSRDLIDEHKPIIESNTNDNTNNNKTNVNNSNSNNNSSSDNNNNSNDSNNNSNDNNRAEWKFQLIKNNFSVKDFEYTHTIY